MSTTLSDTIMLQIEFLKMTRELVDELPLSKKKAAAIRLMKDNVAVVVVLESKEVSSVTNMLQFRNRHFICVANTHIQFDPELTDVKLLQVAELLLSLDRITNSLVSRYPGAVIHVVLSGDFNSLPGSGAAYFPFLVGCWEVKLLQRNNAAHQLIALKNVHPNHPELLVDPFNVLRRTKLSHNMHLVSAYASLLQTSRDEPDFRRQQTLVDSSTKEPLFTNFTGKFTGTLDYIFYTEDTLVVDGLLELLDADVLSKNSALPSPIWPSDHIALMGSFRIKQNPHRVS
ncbi:Endonuclease/Exonuclease/phosphatase [Asimina triloba]